MKNIHKAMFNIAIIFFLFVFTKMTFAFESGIYEVEKIGDNSYLFTYVWGENNKTNIGVVASEDGFLLINTMMLDQVDVLERELAKISDKPVKYVLNSNADWYNTSANEYFADKGATIVAHQDSIYELNNYSNLLFADSFTMEFGGEKISAFKSGAHSAGHVNIHLENANAIFVADSFSPRWVAPLGPAGIEGQIDGLKSIVDWSDSNTFIIPGNVAISTHVKRADVLLEIENRKNLFRRISMLQERGISTDQIIKDKQVVEYLKGYEQYELWHAKPWLYDRINFHRINNKKLLTQQELDEFSGDYALPDGRIIKIFSKNRQLYARAKGIFYFNLVSSGGDKFWFNSENFSQSFLFIRDSNHKVTGIKVIFEPNSSHHLQRLASMEITRIDNNH